MSEAHSIDSLSDEAFRWYLTGLADGEGCFHLHKFQRQNARFPIWRAEFVILMRDDEEPNLLAIMRRLGCGRLYRVGRPKDATNWHPTVRWRVYRLGEVANIIVPHFEHFPLQFKKAKDFTVWKKAVSILAKRKPGRPRNSEGISFGERTILEALCSQLKQVRAYESTPTSSKEKGEDFLPWCD